MVAREVDLSRSRALARLMDDAVTVPGTSAGLGLDALVGLIPGIGDAVGSTVSGTIVYDAVRARVPMHLLAQMAMNLLIDAGLGLLPGVGDLIDVAHRANRKNVRILLAEVERQPMREQPTLGYILGASLLLVLPLLAGLAAAALGLWFLWRILFG